MPAGPKSLFGHLKLTRNVWWLPQMSMITRRTWHKLVSRKAEWSSQALILRKACHLDPEKLAERPWDTSLPPPFPSSLSALWWHYHTRPPLVSAALAPSSPAIHVMTPPQAGGATTFPSLLRNAQILQLKVPCHRSPLPPNPNPRKTRTVDYSSHRLLAKPLSLQLGPVKA